MKILFVSSGNSSFSISAFTKEQGESLRDVGVLVDCFLIKGHGILGYLKNLTKLKKKIKEGKYNLIHAHYGLSGLLSVLQRKIPVLITFHGGDIYKEQSNLILLFTSCIASYLSSYNIFVNAKIPYCFKINKYAVIPCGVNLKKTYPMDKENCRRKLGLDNKKILILFSSAFNNPVKNFPLAKKAVKLLNNGNCELIELNGYTRDQVTMLMNAVDLCIMTSFSEGSPQFIKEAMACNTPIVSTDVGDVKEVIGKTEGCYITSFEPKDVADKIKMAIAFGKRTNGRENIRHLEISVIARQIIDIYKKVLAK